MIPITLPDAAWEGAQDGIEALLDKWLVAPGERVTKGQLIASAVLVKAAMDIEAPADGVIDSIAVHDGESFASGTVLAYFRSE
jgi:pyruvate/2-oxoglutarate dehydrogenase complex dihydrolipoamide acyltransferase (E2) component